MRNNPCSKHGNAVFTQLFQGAAEVCEFEKKGVNFFPIEVYFPDFKLHADLTLPSQKIFFDMLLPSLGRLQCFALSMTKDEDDAKDIVSEAILKALHHFKYISSKREFEVYLFKTTQRIFYTSRSRKKIFVRLTEEFESMEDARSLQREAQFDVDLMLSCLDKLPEKQKEAITLYEITDFSIEEIRQIQGGTGSGVKTRLMRARKRLEELLVERDESPSTDATQHDERR